MARRSVLEQFELTALAVMARVMAHEDVPEIERQAALETLATVRARGRKREIAKRRYKARKAKAAQAAQEAALNEQAEKAREALQKHYADLKAEAEKRKAEREANPPAPVPPLQFPRKEYFHDELAGIAEDRRRAAARLDPRYQDY